MVSILRIISLATLFVCLVSEAEAKSYSSCVTAFAFYAKVRQPHKAFATTNGSIPGHGDMACGGSGGNDLGRAEFMALKRCASESKRGHFTGKCVIIRKQ